MAWRHLSDKQWNAIQPHLPPVRPKPKGGRPRADDRKCFEGILWLTWTGAPWSEMPPAYGKPSTVHDRLTEWAATCVLLNLWRAFLDQLNERQQLRWNECFIDGTFVTAKKGVNWSGKRREAREQSSGYWPMAQVLRSEYTWRRRVHRK